MSLAKEAYDNDFEDECVPFTTTLEQKARFYKIALEMFKSGLSYEFSNKLTLLADYEGVYDLLVMWHKEKDPKERDEIIADLQEEIDEFTQENQYSKIRPFINFDDLDSIAKDIVGFKKKLLTEVNKRGGISVLAKKSGIPQPSLSRFFHTASMPRQTTLYKIANALGLSETEVRSKWTR